LEEYDDSFFFQDDDDLDNIATVFDRMEEGISKWPKHEGGKSRHMQTHKNMVAGQNYLVCDYFEKTPS
jgi:hypothetical protein